MTRLRASTHLAHGANQLFESWISTLQRDGFDIEASAGDDVARDADVVFACGLLTSMRVGQGQPLVVVASPIFDGETSACYRSVIVARRERSIERLLPEAGLRLAVNEYGSWSGWHGLKEHLRTTDVPSTAIGEHVMTGGHVRSIDAVLVGRADIASIDHSVWAACCAEDARLEQLAVVETTRSWPAPPLSIKATLPDRLRTRLSEAVLALPSVDPARLSDYAFMVNEVEQHPTWP